MKPDAVRQRKRIDRIRLQAEAQARSGMAGVSGSTPKPASGAQASGPTDPAVPSIPLHTTKTLNIGGADRFQSVPVLASSDGGPRPVVPPAEPANPESPPDASTSASDGSSAPSPPPSATPGVAPGLITPEEAKLFAKALGAYFRFGSSMLLAKHPEFAGGLVQISGTIDEFRKNFEIAAALVEGCGERVAIKYNLRIPYLDEGVTIAAIGIATYGLAGKPSELGSKQMKNAEEQARANAARNANPPPEKPQPKVGHSNGAAPPAPEPDAYTPTPIGSDTGGVRLG